MTRDFKTSPYEPTREWETAEPEEGMRRLEERSGAGPIGMTLAALDSSLSSLSEQVTDLEQKLVVVLHPESRSAQDLEDHEIALAVEEPSGSPFAAYLLKLQKRVAQISEQLEEIARRLEL